MYMIELEIFQAPSCGWRLIKWKDFDVAPTPQPWLYLRNLGLFWARSKGGSSVPGKRHIGGMQPIVQ